jgi:hypothetical protein
MFHRREKNHLLVQMGKNTRFLCSKYVISNINLALLDSKGGVHKHKQQQAAQHNVVSKHFLECSTACCAGILRFFRSRLINANPQFETICTCSPSSENTSLNCKLLLSSQNQNKTQSKDAFLIWQQELCTANDGSARTSLKKIKQK